MIVENILSHFPKGYTPSEEQKRVLVSIQEAVEDEEKFIVLCAPTGFGKSFVPATLASWAPKVQEVEDFVNAVTNYDAFKMESDASAKTYTYANSMLELPRAGVFTLTVTKQLQDQYLALFNESVSTLKGKRNYQCDVDDSFDVEMAPCLASPKLMKDCWQKHRCPYYEARIKALIAQHGVLNYSMYLALPDHVRARKFLVCDEASELEEELVKHFSVNVEYTKLKFLGIDMSRLSTDNPKTAKPWLNDVWVQVRAKSQALQQEIKNGKFKTLGNRAIYAASMEQQLSKVLEAWGSADYVVEYDAKGVTFVPLKIDRLAEKLFNLVDNVILMSATIINHKHFAASLGIKKYKYIEAASAFDPAKSPIYITKGTPLGYSTITANLPKVVDNIKTLASHHKGQKGIIHTHSLAITQALQSKLVGSRYLYREEGVVNEELIREHTTRTDDTVLVSPSLTMGLDLRGNLGLWQVIVKLPYAPLGNKRIKTLFEVDKDWYTRAMLSQLVQASGRCTRSKTDESVTYIMDSNAVRAIQDNKHLLPKHFLARIK